jgi:hypothetical protein
MLMITCFIRWLSSRLSRVLVASLALVLTLLPSASPALARAQRTALEGTETKFFHPETLDRTIIAGPWEIHIGQTVTGVFDFGALAGTLVWEATDRIDFSTGNGQVRGKVSYTDIASEVTCTGNAVGKITSFLLTAKIVAQCSDGSKLQGTLQDTSNNGVQINSTFHGELLSP